MFPTSRPPRRRVRRHLKAVPAFASTPVGSRLADPARSAWDRALYEAGLNWKSSATVAEVVAALVPPMQLFIASLHARRNGIPGDPNLPGSPDAGLDEVGAVEMMGLIRDLQRAAGCSDAEHPQAAEH